MSALLSSRRAAGLAAAAAIGLSTALLSVPGVAAAAEDDIDLTSATTTSVVVPSTACAVTWEVTGAAGGDAAGSHGGYGDTVAVTTTVTPGSTLLVQPGQRGGSDGTGGTSGAESSGGSGGTGAGGGGGASIVRTGTALDSPVLVLAAGGGGAGTQAAGGDAGTDGTTYPAGSDGYTGGEGAQGGTPGHGGTAPGGSPAVDGADGAALVGGDGPPGAGGGGGGLAGGGSGASDGTDGSGGGGGSSAPTDQPYNEGYPDPDPTVTTASVGEGSVRGTWVLCDTPYGPHGFYDGWAGDEELSVVFFTGTDSSGHPRVAAVTGWELSLDGGEWSTPATTEPVTVSEPGGSGGHAALRATVTGLINGHPYAVRVRPTSAAGPGEEVDETLLLTPQAPAEVPSTVPPVTPQNPAAPSSVPASSGALTGTGSTVTPGGQITVSGTGYRPGSTIDLYVYSTPIQVGTATADANGAFTAVVTLPAGLATGTHHLVAAGLDPSGDPRYLVSEVTVAASGSGASTLAYTGSEPLPLLVCAGVLLMAGSALVVLGRRRRIT